MEAMQSADAAASDSPMVAEVGDKLNGDDDMDFTITMNESEDEGSSDTPPNDPVASDPIKCKPSPLVTVNGMTGSDGESQQSPMGDEKTDLAGRGEEGETLTNGQQEETEPNGHTEVADQQAEAVDSVDREEEAQDEHQEAGQDDECKKESQSEGDVDGNSEDTRPKKGEESTEVNCHPDSSNHRVSAPKDKDKVSDAGRKGTDSNEKYESEDDDVVELGGSPMKFVTGKTKMAVSSAKAKGMGTVASSNAASLLPYLGSLQGASFVQSSTGMQVVLPPGTPGMQGLGSMFIPNNAGFYGTNTKGGIMQPSVGNSGYNMPGDRGAMPPYRQGVASAQTMPPALSNVPEKPTSSMGMIEMIRWEVENHINIKPKYVKPQPKAELGHLAKWVFELGSDMAKEYVYHDLVRIQRRRNDEGSLSAKEKEDFAKLQEIDRELNHKVGRLKFRLNKSCRCGFRTELNNVLYHHQQCAHNDRGGFLRCILCKFSSRQANAFRFHMESEHGRVGTVESHPSFYECQLCPYETNHSNRLEQHKTRCQRQYREAVNLHPSCLTGPEVNLCLENVFYFVFTRQFMNSIIPKTQANARSTATKIRDMPTKGVDSNMQQRKGMGSMSTATTTVASGRQILPRSAVQYQQGAITKQQTPVRAALSRNLPSMAKGGTTLNQGFAPNAVRAQQPRPPDQPNQPNNGFEVCEICGGYVKDRKALRIHFYYAHRIDMPFGVFERPQPPLYCATCFARFWTAQGLQKHIEVHKNDMMNATQNTNGVAGKCISCGHRVPNILMHMRMVHNREMRHYLAALMCIFCGARFTTKMEVEDHMGKVHGIAIRSSKGHSANSQPQLTNSPASAGRPMAKTASPAGRPGAGGAKASGGKSGRSSQCVLCNLSFTRNVDLTRHCMRVHHTCMKCGLVVVDRESLARHTCLHSASGMRTCQICCESGFHPAYYIKHMRDKHLRKCSVVLRHIDRAVVESMKRPITISDSEEDEEVESSPSAPKLLKTEAGQEQEGSVARGQSQEESGAGAGEGQAQDGSASVAADGGEGGSVQQQDTGEDGTGERSDKCETDEARGGSEPSAQGADQDFGDSVDGDEDRGDENRGDPDATHSKGDVSPRPPTDSEGEGDRQAAGSSASNNCEQSDSQGCGEKRKLESSECEEYPDSKSQKLCDSREDES